MVIVLEFLLLSWREASMGFCSDSPVILTPHVPDTLSLAAEPLTHSLPMGNPVPQSQGSGSHSGGDLPSFVLEPDKGGNDRADSSPAIPALLAALHPYLWPWDLRNPRGKLADCLLIPEWWIELRVHRAPWKLFISAHLSGL